MSDIDPYKIPAFQRRGKVGSSKLSRSRLLEESKKEYKAPVKNDVRMQVNQPNDQIILKQRLQRKLAERKVSAPSGFATLSNIEKAEVHSAPSQNIFIPEWRKMETIGEVSQYFDKIHVAVLIIEKPVKVGDRLLIQSEKGLFEQSIESMQINRKDVQKAKRGDNIGMKVKFNPLKKGLVYKIIAEG